jgi:hypothetical protein
MKNQISCALVALAALSSVAQAQTSVGVSIGINQPGVYGRIDIGNYPQPVTVYPQPVIIQQAPRGVPMQPMYLYVPPGHQKNWAKHCGAYNACGHPVYFVKEDWVRDQYERERGNGSRGQGDKGERGKGHGHGHNKPGRD